jgi:hypothetical protein
MVDYYKENAPATTADSRLDSYTRYEFQFSGLECRVLGSFFRVSSGRTAFGADVDNFYSPNNYSVYKPAGRILEYIVNFREGVGIPGGEGDVRIGQVRYSSSRRHISLEPVPVYVSAVDFLGQRTALFGMTRTGKSNTLKKIVQATADLSPRGATLGSTPISPVGQIIFDVNGEYANDNQQDEGTAIYQLFGSDVTRYSLLAKPGFGVMKLNFYNALREGLGLVQANLAEDTSVYTRAFLNVNWEEPDPNDFSATTRYGRRVACYQCILYAAGFDPPAGFTVTFRGEGTINGWLGGLDPSRGLALDDATRWFSEVWDRYDRDPFFASYRQTKGRDWADDDLQNLLRFLTRRPRPGGAANEAGFRKLIPLRDFHTSTVGRTFLDEIIDLLRAGKIVIVDLSQGDPVVQRTYSDRLCSRIFDDAMKRFITNEPSNFVQMYFEEAHNLFPRKGDPNL